MVPESDLQRQIAAYRAMTGQQRLQISFWLYEQEYAAELKLVRTENPDWTEEKAEREVKRRFRRKAGIPDSISDLIDVEPIIVDATVHPRPNERTIPHEARYAHSELPQLRRSDESGLIQHR